MSIKTSLNALSCNCCLFNLSKNEKFNCLTLMVACFLLKSVMSNTSRINGIIGMKTSVELDRAIKALTQ